MKSVHQIYDRIEYLEQFILNNKLLVIDHGLDAMNAELQALRWVIQ